MASNHRCRSMSMKQKHQWSGNIDNVERSWMCTGGWRCCQVPWCALMRHQLKYMFIFLFFLLTWTRIKWKNFNKIKWYFRKWTYCWLKESITTNIWFIIKIKILNLIIGFSDKKKKKKFKIERTTSVGTVLFSAIGWSTGRAYTHT